MKSLLLLIPMIIAGIIGSSVAGAAEDYVTPQIQNIPNEISNCDTIQEKGWKDICENQKTTYNKGITLINFVGFFSGFGIVGVIIKGIMD